MTMQHGNHPTSRDPGPKRRSLPQRLRRRAWYGLLAAAIRAAETLPEPVVRAVFFGLADLLWRRRTPGVGQLERNLARVVGPDADLRALTRDALRSYARYWVEFFRLPKLGRRIDDGMDVEGFEHIEAAAQAGRGVILALPHLGNWDQAGAWLARHGYPFTTVAERLRPDRLFRRFVAVRQRLGMEVLGLDGDRSTFTTLVRRLRAGGVVCLVADRDLAGDGVPVKFFGEETTLPPGPAALAVTTGAALLPVELWFTRRGENGRRIDGWGARVHPPLDVPPPAPDADRAERIATLTQQLADAFAAAIAAHPQDWHMMQPLWTADREPRT